MPTYVAPLAEFRFILHDLLRIDRLSDVPPFGEAGAELIDAFLEGAAKICESIALPLNYSGDREGCTWHDGAVTTPKGFPKAYKAFANGGWIGLSLSPEFDGKGLPGVLAESFYEMVCSANMAFSGFIELTEAIIAAIHDHGTPEQKRVYLPRLASGEWTGAMHLTESHAGSDLGLVRTRAEPHLDGSYRITGQKCFITNAEHDLGDNIVNLVLARMRGAPQGTRGLSLFLVPKFLVSPNGMLGERNGIRCISLEHKLGLKAAPTGTYNFEDAVGYLVGEENGGLKSMFTMVNDARLGVAIQGLAIAETAYQNAALYARERRQGRATPRASQHGEEADPIVAHPDVRRMLMTMRAFVEAARALGLWVTLQIDLSKHHPDGALRRQADDMASLLTPVIKAYFTDWGSRVADLCVQCHGGHGYVHDTGVDQFLRDVRVTRLYEGTNGIQALDLVRRKLQLNDGTAVGAFFDLIDGTISELRSEPELKEWIAAVETALGELRTATAWMQERVGTEDAAAGAVDYLELFGLVALAWFWLKSAGAAHAALTGQQAADRFFRGKLATARFFFLRLLPEASIFARRAMLGGRDLMGIPADAFGPTL